MLVNGVSPGPLRLMSRVLLPAAVLMLAGCSDQGNAPLSPAAPVASAYSEPAAVPDPSRLGGLDMFRGFAPLGIGNRWTYGGRFEVRLNDGPPETMSLAETRRLIGTDVVLGREYVVEEQMRLEGDVVGPTLWIRYRQDRAGLYEADISLVDPPALSPAGLRVQVPRAAQMERMWRIVSTRVPENVGEAYRRAWDHLAAKIDAVNGLLRQSPSRIAVSAGPPGGADSDELTRLAYPLHPGQRWVIRDGPRFESVVEAHDVLRLEPGMMNGFRVRIRSELFDPDDRVVLWYGRDGFLKWDSLLHSTATDEFGNPLGRFTSRETLTLRSLDLVRP